MILLIVSNYSLLGWREVGSSKKPTPDVAESSTSQTEVLRSDATEKEAYSDERGPNNFNSWRQLAESASQEKQFLFASIAKDVNDKRILTYATSKCKPFAPQTVQTHILDEGVGIELSHPREVTKDSWRWKPHTEDSEDLILSTYQGSGFRVTKLRNFGTPLNGSHYLEGETIHSPWHHKHLWSADGKFLFVLAGSSELTLGPRHLLKVDTQNWTVVARVKCLTRSDFIDDMCWSSEGLVIVKSVFGSSEADVRIDPENKAWAPISPRDYGSKLITIHPETMTPKNAWYIAFAREIAGRSDSDLVYAVSNASSVSTIDVTKGQLMNLQANRFEFHHPLVSPDGKFLIANRLYDGNSLNRFRIDKWHLELEAKRNVGFGLKFFSMTPKGECVTVREKEEFLTVEVENFEKVLTKISGPENGRFVLDIANKTGFLCGQKSRSEPLTLQIMQDQRTISIELEDRPTPEQLEMEKLGRLPDRSHLPDELNDQKPFAMSVAPEGRGAIAFTMNAAYWIEVEKPGQSLDFKKEAQKVEDVAFSEAALKQKRRTTLPHKSTRSLAMKPTEEQVVGRVFEIPDTFRIDCLTTNPDSGDVALVVTDGANSVMVIKNSQLSDAGPQSVSTLRFEGVPFVNVTYKKFRQRTFLVVHRDEMIWIVDPQTMQLADSSIGLVNQIDLRDPKHQKWESVKRKPRPVLLAAETDDPYVFYANVSEGADDSKAQYVKIDLSIGEIVGTENVRGYHWRDSSGNLFEAPNLHDPNEFFQVVRDTIFTSGTSVDDKPFFAPRNFDRFTTLAIMHKHPFFVCKSNSHLHFRGRFSPEEFVNINLPKAFHTSTGSFVFDDFRKNRIIVSSVIAFVPKEPHASLFWVLPTAEIELPDLPALAGQFQMPSQAELNKANSIEFKLADPRDQLSLVRAPDGVILEEGKIVWRPTPKDVGRHPFVVRIKAGDTDVLKQFYCEAAYPRTLLPFSATDFSLSFDGNAAVAWSADSIAVIDGNSHKILANSKTSGPIRSAVIAGEYVYLLYTEDNVLEKRRYRDLHIESTHSLTEATIDLKVAQDRFLFLIHSKEPQHNEGFRGKFHALELPSLKTTKLTQLLDSDTLSNQIVVTDDGDWIIGPVVLDPELKGVVQLFSLEWTGIARSRAVSKSGIVLSKHPSKMQLTENKAFAYRDQDFTFTPKVESRFDERLRTFCIKLGLEVSKLKTEEKQLIGLGEMNGLHPNGKILSEGDRIAVLFSNQLFICKLEELGITLKSSDSKPQLRLSSKEKVPVLASKGKTEIKFLVTGGNPPYDISCSGLKALEVDTKRMSINMDGAIVLSELLASPLQATIANLAAKYTAESTAEIALEKYIAKVATNLKPLVKQSINDFPVSISMDVKAKDASGAEVTLTQEVLVLLPRNLVIKDFYEGFDRARSELKMRPKKVVAKPNLPILWEATQQSISDEMRKLYPTQANIDYQLLEERATMASLAVHTRFLVKDPDSRRLRSNRQDQEWELKNGKKKAGKVVGCGPDCIDIVWSDSTLATRFDLSEFSSSSLLKLRFELNQFTRVAQNDFERRDHLGNAVALFRNDFGCTPSYAIVDRLGSPILSWRVALLPYLGYSDLFALFRLDEPWDSPHNLTLLPCMPVYYSPSQPGLELGHATVKAITGKNTAFPLQGIRYMKDLDKPAKDVLMFIEVKKEFSIPWTKPEDIELSSGKAWLEQIHSVQDQDKVQNLKWYGDGILRRESVNIATER